MALAYSDRFRRWSAERPGLGRAVAWISMAFSSEEANAFMAALSGRGMPCGGMASTRILRMTFYQSSAFSGTLAKSALWRDRPPVFSLSLWQVTQYLSTSGRWVAGAGTDWAEIGPVDARQIIANQRL